MGATLYRPFRLRFRAKARRDSEFRPVTRPADLLALMSGPVDGPGPEVFGNVGEVRAMPGNKVEIELFCEEGLSVEKEFGKVAAELEKLGWEVNGW
jgi:hypothetical protein